MVKCVDPALIVAPDRFAKVAKRKKSENFGLTKPFMDLKYEGFFFFFLTVDLVVWVLCQQEESVRIFNGSLWDLNLTFCVSSCSD